MQGLSELVLAGLAGTLLATSANLLVLAPSVHYRNPLRVFAAAGVLVGIGAVLRALAFFSVTHGFEPLGDTCFRTHYVLWAVAAALGPLTARALVSGVEAGVLNVGILLVTLLMAVFAFTPAFLQISAVPAAGGQGMGGVWGGSIEAGDAALDELAIRWAFPALVGFTALASLGSAAGHLAATRPPGPRIPRFLAQVLALAYGATGLLVPLMAAADAGLLWAALAPSIGVLATGTWFLCLLLVNRETIRESDRSLRRLRAELDRVAANALRDPLTGLFNRGFFIEGLHQAMEHLKRDGEPFAVAMLDLDDFKAVNDTFGHKVGDIVLQGVAKVLMRGLRPYDTAARFGGEEFVVILRGIERDVALHIVERLRASIQELAFPGREGGTARVTATFGLVMVREPGRGFDEVLETVDRAMYEGKKSGKNQVRIAE